MNENEIYEVLGLKTPESLSPQSPEAAAPLDAQGEPSEGQGEQNPLTTEDPAEQDEGGAAEGTPGQPKEQEAAEPAGTEKREQTREERARHAAERRKAETEEAVRLAREEERRKAEEELIRTLKEAGLDRDPETGKELKTREDIERAIRQRNRQELDRKIENGTMTAADIEQLLERQQARENRRVREEQERQQFLQSIEGEMAEVRKLRPDVKTIADFGKLDKAQEFYDLVMQGESYIGAIKKLYGEAQEQQRQQMQRQQIVNDLNGLNHLQGAGKTSGVDTEPALSPEEMDAYRMLNPKASDRDIREHWKRYRKKTGR